jgi:hypothetical protein
MHASVRAFVSVAIPFAADCRAQHELVTRLERITAPLLEDVDEFSIRVRATGADQPPAELDFARRGDEFVLEARSRWATFTLRRIDASTELTVPLNDVAFVGAGDAPADDSIRPNGFVSRLLGDRAGGLDLEGNCLTAAGVTALRGLCANVRTGRQRKERVPRYLHRYATTME